MEDKFKDSQVQYSRSDAKKAVEDGNSVLAQEIYESLWENSKKTDPYLLYEYGKILRKNKKSERFVELCRELGGNSPMLSNNHINSVLCWCLYESHIKNYQYKENVEQFNTFIKRAQYILEKCVQENADICFINPYVLTIIKVIKILKMRSSINYQTIISWLEYLDPSKLPDIPYQIQNGEWKNKEIASPKEFYYQSLIKALEKTSQYERCIEMCTKALEEIKKFHYRNHIWFQSRRFFCKCMISEGYPDEIINEYKSFANRYKLWFVYHKLANICLRYNKPSDGLYYACKAFEGNFEAEKMVNLMYDLAMLWEVNGEKENASKFYHGSAYYRNLHHWSLSEELQYAIKKYGLDIEKRPDIKNLKTIVLNHLNSIEPESQRLGGTIINLLSHGKSGFIKPDQGLDNIFFSMRNAEKYKDMRLGTQVTYSLSTDGQKRPIAVEIKIRR